MARFTRSGGEACAVAVRIARAASGKDAVAFCGYHGWHDWYLAANLADEEALDGHLLPGLATAGVPRALKGTARPFAYNDLGGLRGLLEAGDVGTVIMEVERSVPPAPGFLEGVRELTRKHGAVLIFDECTSAFRQVLGGQHLAHGVRPDIATFGKTLGNGYAINAIIGRREVMEAANRSFISSTFWTERIGPAAALAALQAMEDEDAPARVHAIGGEVSDSWVEMGRSLGVELHIGGMQALRTFAIPGRDAAVVKAFITQEMIRSGFLAGNALYASIAHDRAVRSAYLEALAPVITVLATSSEDEVRSRLKSGPTIAPFALLA
jgi:glutamate-1-semialdehyde 2,1-aminomutase